jgi:hypothetical protein
LHQPVVDPYAVKLNDQPPPLSPAAIVPGPLIEASCP